MSLFSLLSLTLSVILLVILVIIYVKIHRREKWSCVDGKCQKILNGMFNSEDECQSDCPNKVQPYRTSQERRLLEKRRERVSERDDDYPQIGFVIA